MKIEIVAKPMVRFEINKELAGALVLMSRSHYDAECRRASEGGIVNGMKNRCILRDGEPFHEDLDFRDCDLLLKICENAGCLQSGEDAHMVRNFAASISKALRTINENRQHIDETWRMAVGD